MHTNHKTAWDRIKQLVDKEMKTIGVPGIALGILFNGEIAAAGFGVTNVKHPLPVTEGTLFQIGSIAKTFTSLAIMRLVEMDQLDLDATVRTYWPDFRVADETVSSQATIRHLLTHTGGWVGDFFRDTGAGDDALTKYVNEMVELEQLAPLGKIWSYSNSGFDVAGYIIEKSTGQSFEVALEELVLNPLGLKNVCLDPGAVMTHRFVVGHYVTNEGAVVARHWPLPRHANPDGGVICDVKDLLRYGRFHLGNGTTREGVRLLRPESMALMHSPQVSIWKDREAMGLAWFIDQVKGTRHLWSSGVTNGQNAFLRLIPEHSFAIAILTNANQGWSVIEKVDKWALKTYLGQEIIEPTQIKTSEEDLRPYLGRYTRPFADIELSLQDGKLLGQLAYKLGFDKDAPPLPSPPPMPLALCEKDRLIVLDGPFQGDKAEVIRQGDGSVGWLRLSRRLHRKFAP